MCLLVINMWVDICNLWGCACRVPNACVCFLLQGYISLITLCNRAFVLHWDSGTVFFSPTFNLNTVSVQKKIEFEFVEMNWICKSTNPFYLPTDLKHRKLPITGRRQARENSAPCRLPHRSFRTGCRVAGLPIQPIEVRSEKPDATKERKEREGAGGLSSAQTAYGVWAAEPTEQMRGATPLVGPVHAPLRTAAPTRLAGWVATDWWCRAAGRRTCRLSRFSLIIYRERNLLHRHDLRRETFYRTGYGRSIWIPRVNM